MLRTLRRPIEYVLARLARAILPRCSRRFILRLARILGGLAYIVIGRQRNVAMANLALVLPEQTPLQHRRHLRTSLESFVLAMLDTFWLARHTQTRIQELVRFDPTFAQAIFRPGAQICLTAHMGNWEVLGLSVSQRGFPLTSVTAPLKNPWVDHIFTELRNLTGQRTVSKQGAVRALLKTLRGGGQIALVLDQNTKPVQGGLFVDFFGLKAPFSSAAALLALRTGAPMVIGACVPDGQGGYVTPPIKHIDYTGLPENEAAAVLELTQRIARGLEELIRAYPSYWLWTYKRWKIRPDDANPADYPFYTRALRPGDLPATRGSRPESPHSSE